MLGLLNLEEIEGLLLDIPVQVDALEQHRADALENVHAWLTRLESVLINNRLPVAGSVAALRGVLASARSGAIPPDIRFGRSTTARRRTVAVALDVIRRVADLVSDSIRADASRRAEAQRVTRQLVAAARFKGLIPERLDDLDPTGSLRAMSARMSEDPEIGPGMANLRGLAGPNDSLVHLDRVLTRDRPPS